MYRIASAVILMIIATAGVANCQVVEPEQPAAVVEELRRAAAAAQSAGTDTRAALVDELRTRYAERPGDLIIMQDNQRAVATRMAAATGDPVSYSIAGRLDESGSSTGPLPLEIVSAIRSDSHLKTMNVASGSANSFRVVDGVAVADDRSTFTAAFGFQTLDEFHAWYGAYGEALHRAIERAGADEVRFNLSVVPVEGPRTF